MEKLLILDTSYKSDGESEIHPFIEDEVKQFKFTILVKMFLSEQKAAAELMECRSYDGYLYKTLYFFNVMTSLQISSRNYDESFKTQNISLFRCQLIPLLQLSIGTREL